MIEYYTIGIIALLAAISPGPDFVIVAKNALAHDRVKAMLTSLGIGIGILVHSTYIILGLGLVISQSLLLFSIIKYLGASYLIYLGLKNLFAKQGKTLGSVSNNASTKGLSAWKAFQNGFLTNVLNPKCTFFMLSVFTLVVKPHTSAFFQATYGIEIALITAGWFVFLSLGLTHKVIKAKIDKAQKVVSKVMGAVLMIKSKSYCKFSSSKISPT